MITGESAAPEMQAAIRAHIEAQPEVERIISLITLQWGEQLMIAVQAKMQRQTSDLALIDAINTVEAGIQARWPQAKWCFFEPDVEAGRGLTAGRIGARFTQGGCMNRCAASVQSALRHDTCDHTASTHGESHLFALLNEWICR